MKKINSIILSLLLMICLTIGVDAKSVIKETSSNFTGDTYIIGSTKFDSSYTVTASRAAKAGLDEAYLRQNVYHDFSRDFELKTYYYSELDESWSVIKADGTGIVELTTQQTKDLEENLNIFFVNNEEKTLTVSVPTGTNVDEESIKPINNVDGDALYNDGTITVPASWINGFSFSTDKTTVTVELGDSDSEELATPVVKYLPELKINIPNEAYVGEEFEFSISTILSELGYNYEGVQVTGDGGLDNKEYEAKLTLYYKYGEDTWIPLTTNFGGDGGFPLKTATSDFKAKFSEARTYSFVYAIKSVDAKDGIDIKKTASINIISNDKIARVGETYYTSLADALTNASSKEVVLLKDTTITSSIVLNNLTTTLNLNGKTLSIENTETDFTRIVLTGTTNFTVKNGTINVVGGHNQDSYAFKVADESTLNVESDAKINIASTNLQQYGIFVVNKATVNFAGEIIIKNTVAKNAKVDVYAISGNGRADLGEQNTTVNITGGKIIVEHGVALYLPQTGTTNISGGVLTADTVVGIKSGKLNVTGGTLTANGVKADATAYNNGIIKTGDVIIVEENASYADNVIVNITGGTLSSTKGYVLHEYNPTTNTMSVTGTYVYKTFVTENNFYYNDEIVGDYKVGDVYYITIEDALAHANGKEIVLVKDVTINKQIDVKDNLVTTLNLNGKKITIKNESNNFISRFFLQGNAELTVKNGTIDSVGGVNTYGAYAFKVGGNSKLTINSDVKIIIEDPKYDNHGVFILDKATLNFAGEMEVKGSTDGTEFFGIAGYGTDHSQNTVINITGGKITVNEGAALFLPQPGVTNITGGELTANTVVGVKSGTLNIAGGKIIANGVKSSAAEFNNGLVLTGDAILVEENDNYADNVLINIIGGELSSANGYILHEFITNLEDHLTMQSIGLYTYRNQVDANNFFYTNTKLPA